MLECVGFSSLMLEWEYLLKLSVLLSKQNFINFLGKKHAIFLKQASKYLTVVSAISSQSFIIF